MKMDSEYHNQRGYYTVRYDDRSRWPREGDHYHFFQGDREIAIYADSLVIMHEPSGKFNNKEIEELKKYVFTHYMRDKANYM